MKKNILLICALCICAFSNATYYVAPTAQGAGDGSSWDNASGDIQATIDMAVTATGAQEVWFKAGTYTLSATIVLNPNVSLYGGFAGTEATLAARAKGADAWTFTNATVLSGNNSVRVMELTSPDNSNSITVGGFTIQNGNSSSYTIKNGAGIYTVGGATIKNCIIKNNDTGAVGGGMYIGAGVSTANTLVSGCYFTGNTGSTSTATNSKGLGISVSTNATQTSAIIVEKCLFEKQADPIVGAITASNTADGTTAGTYSSQLTINGCTIRNCESGTGFQIMRLIGNVRLINCLAYNNKGGNGICHLTLAASATNCTFANNKGAVFSGQTTAATTLLDKVNVNNCIVYNNEVSSNTNLTLATLPHYKYNNNLLQSAPVSPFAEVNSTLIDATNKDGIFNMPTTFVGLSTEVTTESAIASADWTLKAGSAAISKGNSSLFPTDVAQTDIINHVRIGETIEAGAYEYNTGTVTAVKSTVTTSAINFIPGSNGMVSKIDGSVQVYSLSGKTIISEKVTNGQLIPLAKGMYIVKSVSEAGVNVTKIVL